MGTYLPYELARGIVPRRKKAASPASQTKSALETMEHVALLKRWYFRGTRAVEIFLADEKGKLPMRRVVRGISRVFRGEKPEVEI